MKLIAPPIVLVIIAAAAIGFGGYEVFSPWSNAFGKTHWRGDRGSRVVALTFDDGPNEPYTTEILNILRAERVKGTFFLIGQNVRRYPATAERIAREGEAIGNHSDTHPPGFALDLPRFLQRELNRTEESIHAATGIYPRYFRPPQGIRSPWLMSLLQKDSLVMVTWDDAPNDWENLGPKELVSRTLAQVHPGAIILLHDGLNTADRPNRSATVAALPEIIRRLRGMGYGFATIPEILHGPASLLHPLTGWTRSRVAPQSR